MATWRPDPSFYPSPRMAAKAPKETLAYVAAFDPERTRPDAIAVVDVDPASSSYSQIVGQVEMPNVGDELHHFGWNACSSCLCPNAPHPHVERRYLIVPGLRSSNIHVLDTKPDPKKPKLVKTVKAAEIAERADYSRPHTVHCGPDGIYVTALGNAAVRGFLRESPGAAAAAAAMGSDMVRLYEDLLFIKETGARAAPTPWHQDSSHWPAKGSMMSSLWVSLEETSAETGAMKMVVGSHLAPLHTPLPQVSLD